ncbi:uncharacterized protein LOC121853217 [Homarus americanus]|uniref:uncharacterized protein LOC121853217 n=1 Tax=Homarus americanus TaxID=6706 RepID=UPI001C45FF8A|nr:uncharacterized protein LOC121853217 [Homarus americanus]
MSFSFSFPFSSCRRKFVFIDSKVSVTALEWKTNSLPICACRGIEFYDVIVYKIQQHACTHALLPHLTNFTTPGIYQQNIQVINDWLSNSDPVVNPKEKTSMIHNKSPVSSVVLDRGHCVGDPQTTRDKEYCVCLRPDKYVQMSTSVLHQGNSFSNPQGAAIELKATLDKHFPTSTITDINICPPVNYSRCTLYSLKQGNRYPDGSIIVL